MIGLAELLEQKTALLTKVRDFKALGYPGSPHFYTVRVPIINRVLRPGQSTPNLARDFEGASGFIVRAQVVSTSPLLEVLLQFKGREPQSGVIDLTATIESIFEEGSFRPSASGLPYITRYDQPGGVFSAVAGPAPPGIPFAGRPARGVLTNLDDHDVTVSAELLATLDGTTLPG